MKNLKIPIAALAFVCLWAFIALFPPTREIVRAPPTALGVSGDSISSLSDERWNELVRRFPASPVPLGWKLERDVYRAQGIAEFRRALAQFDRLSVRFPNDLSLAAERLRLSLTHPITIPSREAAPERAAPQKKAWLSDADLEIAGRIAREGEARDAGNAFWPWMDATFHFARRENQAGIAALERAAKAARYDDGFSATLKARMQWFEKSAHPILEEKINVFFGTPSSEVASSGDVVSAATLDAIRARERGDKAGAARIGAAILGASAARVRSENELTIRRSQYFARRFLEKFSGIRPPQEAQLPNGSWPYIDPKIHDAELVRAWKNFALQNGEKPWSQRADFLLADSKNDPATQYLHSDLWREFGLRAPWGHIALSAPTFLLVLAALCWIGALVWLLGALTNRITERVGDESASMPTRGEVAGCANFSFWAMLGVSLVFLSWYWATNFDFFSLYIERYQGQVAGFAAFAGALLIGIWLLPVAFAGWRRGHRIVRVAPLPSTKNEGASRKRGATKNDSEPLPSPKNEGPKRVARAISWAIFLLSAFAAWTNGGSYGYGIWDDTLLQMPYSLGIALAAFCIALALDLERLRRLNLRIGPRLRIEKRGAAPQSEALALKLARIGLWLLSPALLFFAMSGAMWNLTWPDALLFLAAALAAFGAAFVLELRGARREGFRFALSLGARSAGVLSLAWSVVFLGLCLGLWPLRLEMNHQLDRRLQIGEVAWMREQVANAPQPKS